jgi:hypothetical protein
VLPGALSQLRLLMRIATREVLSPSEGRHTGMYRAITGKVEACFAMLSQHKEDSLRYR